MEAIFIALINKINASDLVYLVLLAGGGYLYLTQRREDREDRKAMLEVLKTHTDAMNTFKDVMGGTLNEIKNAISAVTGRPL